MYSLHILESSVTSYSLIALNPGSPPPNSPSNLVPFLHQLPHLNSGPYLFLVSRFPFPPVNLLSKLQPQITFQKPRVVGVTPLLAPHCPGKLIRNTDSHGQAHPQKNGVSGRTEALIFVLSSGSLAPPASPGAPAAIPLPTLQSSHGEHPPLDKNKLLPHLAIAFFLCGKPGEVFLCGRPSSIPGSGRSPGEGNGNPLQYSCLENPMY